MELVANTSENRLKELPEIYTETPAYQTGKIKATEKIFDKILKQVPSTPQKTVTVTFDEKTNNWNTEEELMQMKKIKELKIYLDLFKMTQKVFFIW